MDKKELNEQLRLFARVDNKSLTSLIEKSEIDKSKFDYFEQNQEYFQQTKEDILYDIDILLNTDYKDKIEELLNNQFKKSERKEDKDKVIYHYSNLHTNNRTINDYLNNYKDFINNHYDKLIRFIYDNGRDYLFVDPLDAIETPNFIMKINIFDLHWTWFDNSFSNYKKLLDKAKELQYNIKIRAEKKKSDIEKEEYRQRVEMTKDEYKKKKKKKKKKALPGYENNKNPYSWDDVIIKYDREKNKCFYVNGKGLPKLNIFDKARKQKSFFLSAIENKGEPLGEKLGRTKSRILSEINEKLKNNFKKETNPIEWNRNQQSWKILFETLHL